MSSDKKDDITKNIYLIRHGETFWNSLGLRQGSQNDIDLNDKGKEQAKITGEFLKGRMKDGQKIDLILSSPLKRSIQTAKIIADANGYTDDIIIKKYLTETDMGKLAIGLTDEEMKKDNFYDEFFVEMDKYFSMDHIDKKLAFDEIPELFTKKYKMESHKHIKKRIKKLIKLLIKTNGKNIVVVTHNGTIEWINRVILNTNDTIKGDLTNGKNCHLTYYLLNKKKFKLIIAPNTLHLKK